MEAGYTSPDARVKLLGVEAQAFIDRLPQEDRDLFQRADLGMHIEAFLEGHPVGQFLANMLEIEREDALEALVRAMSAKPEDAAEHRKHHRRVELCDLVKGWLIDAISTGREAQEALRNKDHTD